MRDQKNNIALVLALAPVAIVADAANVTAIIDTKGYESLTFDIMSGVVTDGAYAILIEDGDDSALSDNAAVVDAELIGTEANAAFALTDDATVKSIGYIGHKRYVRMTITSSATSSGGLFSVAAKLGHAHIRKDVTNLDAA